MIKGFRPLSLGSYTKFMVLILGLIMFIPIFIASCSSPSHNTHVTTPNDYSHVTIFYSPHQDDESSGLSVGIVNAIERGDRVFLVLMTDGKATCAVDKINGIDEHGKKVFCDIHKKFHNPIAEGYAPITRDDLGRARDIEFKRAAAALGVNSKNILFCHFPDGGLKEEDAEEVILKMEKKYPHALHAGASYYEYNNDHKSVGRALAKLYKSGKISDIRLYVNVLYYTGKSGYAEKPYISRYLRRDVPENLRYEYPSNAGEEKVRSAVYSYMDWDPKNMKYAVGGHSTPSIANFLNGKLNIYGIWHTPEM
jgi:Uncharacterized proteins, LmbE homologs